MAANDRPEGAQRGPSVIAKLLEWARLSARQAGLLGLISLVGITLCIGMAWRLQELHDRALRAEVVMAARARVELVRSSWLRSLEALHATVAFLEVTPELTRETFHHLVSASIERLPEVQALEWIPRVPAAERGAYESAAWSEGYPGYRFNEIGPDGALRAATPRPEYFPVYYAEPPDRNLPALGLDLGAHPLRRSALDRARDTGQPAATAPVRLAQETQAGQLGLLVFAPVRDRTLPRSAAPGTGAPALRGFGLVVLRIPDFVGPAFASAGAEGLEVRVSDVAHPELALFTHGATARAPRLVGAELLAHHTSLELAGRTWQLEFKPTPLFVRRHGSLEPLVYPLAALVLTWLIVAYTARGMRRTLEIERRVDERTHALTREVSVRRKAEGALRVAEAKYRNIFENAILGIFQSTPGGLYLDANPALARIYGYDSPAELMRSVRDIGQQLYVDPQQRSEFAGRLQEHGSVSDFLAEVHRKDGSRIWISETAVAVRDNAGAVLYYEGSVQDVSARIAAEEAQKRSYEWLEERVRARTSELAEANSRLHAEVLIRKSAQDEAAQARQAQAQFLASMSHEIRTPLNAIIGYSQILQRYDDMDALHDEAIQAIVQGGNHLLTLVDEVIDLSKIEAGHVELQTGDFNLGALVSGLSFMFRNKCEKKGLSLRIEGLGALPWWVRGDEGKLRQVLINLLGNAVKFTEHGEVRLRVVPEGDSVFRFEVIDSGVGIAAAEQARVFGEFYQGEPSGAGEGAGLGLAISRKLVACMGGQLELRSTPGWGSNFYFTLELEPPLAVVASQANARHPRVRLAESTRCRVLVVDDLEVNRNVLRHLLVAIGCDVDSAASGDDALGAIARVKPDLVFLDVLMPGRDGIDTARAIRQLTAPAPPKLVAFSASALESQRASYLSAGFDAFIPKPFRAERINDCLVRLLGLTFEAEPTAGEPAPLEIGSVRVPAPLLAQLREAAESYQVTRLKLSFEQLERCGADHRILAAQLRASAARYDMAAVLDALERVQPEGGYAA